MLKRSTMAKVLWYSWLITLHFNNVGLAVSPSYPHSVVDSSSPTSAH
jgi:hypothetical protein